MGCPELPFVSVERDFDAAWLNHVLNDPSVRPHVADMSYGELDMSRHVKFPGTIVLRGEFGAFFLTQMITGSYEVHTQILPQGRGEWASKFVEAASFWMFTHTDAYEIVTRIPHGHKSAKALAIGGGLKFEFSEDGTMRYLERNVPLDVHSITIQQWAANAPGMIETGEWLHHRFCDEELRLGLFPGTAEAELANVGLRSTPHPNQPIHNRYVGLLYHMAKNGQMLKGINLYNRWASISRQPANRFVAFISDDPPTIQFDQTHISLLPDGDVRMSLFQYSAQGAHNGRYH